MQKPITITHFRSREQKVGKNSFYWHWLLVPPASEAAEVLRAGLEDREVVMYQIESQPASGLHSCKVIAEGTEEEDGRQWARFDISFEFLNSKPR